jgi:hypothetical protein
MFIPGFTQPQQFLEMWAKAAKDQMDRMEQLGEQLGKVQGQSVERAQQAIDESAKLMKESMSYALTLSNEWRKLGIDITRKTTQGMTPGL